MDKTQNWLYIMNCVENIFLILLAGFLCWYFKNGWGVLVLIFSNSFRGYTNKKQEDK